MNKDIEPRNSKGQKHSYHEWYDVVGLCQRVTYKNGEKIGYEEWHKHNTRKETEFYIK